ncbi:ankyrin repeat-containing domain protein [Pyronema domesticum]|nr:ankyrin repeat-containing domain protein [Pyronema domesticum]
MEFARLPNELLLKIGYVCTLKSILSLRSVHRHFHDVFSDIFYGKFAIPASKAIGVACSANPATNAIERHWTSVLKRLLERGIDANTVVSHPLESKYSLLDVAVFQHRYLNATSKEDTEIFRLLLENGANANETEKDKYTQQARETQLHRAVKWGHKPMVEVLLEFGADVDALDKYRMSPLRYACNRWRDRHFEEIIALLLENGADTEGGDWRNMQVLDYAKWKNEVIIEKLPRKAEEAPASNLPSQGATQRAARPPYPSSTSQPVSIQPPQASSPSVNQSNHTAPSTASTAASGGASGGARARTTSPRTAA